MKIEVGVHQGSFTGPLYFLMFVIDTFEIAEKYQEGVKITYAVNTSLVLLHKRKSRIRSLYRSIFNYDSKLVF